MNPTTALPFARDLPRHAHVVESLRTAVRGDEFWRWMELGCSLAAGRGDELSDIDAGIGYRGNTSAEHLIELGTDLVGTAGPIVDLLVHHMPGWPEQTRRFAVEYESGVQLDLVLMPAERRPGLPDGSLALVDKDGTLANPFTPPVAEPPPGETAEEWLMLGWWALSDVAKYLRRGSLHEAVARIGEARTLALQLWAVAIGIPYPSFGLTSLLDYPPFELPDGLEATYARPSSRAEVIEAAWATADLLERAGHDAGSVVGFDPNTPWSGLARRRLGEAAAA